MSSKNRSFQNNYYHANHVIDQYLNQHRNQIIDADQLQQTIDQKLTKPSDHNVFDRHYLAQKYQHHNQPGVDTQYFGQNGYNALPLVTKKQLLNVDPKILNASQVKDLKNNKDNGLYNLNQIFQNQTLKPLTGQQILNVIQSDPNYKKVFETHTKAEIISRHQQTKLQTKANHRHHHQLKDLDPREYYDGNDDFDLK